MAAIMNIYVVSILILVICMTYIVYTILRSKGYFEKFTNKLEKPKMQKMQKIQKK